MTVLYRIVVRTTGSFQPRSTFWAKEVLYCGYDRLEAIRIYHQSTPSDHGGSYGNACRETMAQSRKVRSYFQTV